MANRNKMNSLLKIGAAGAAIYGITKGIQNGTIQKIPQQISKAVQGTFQNDSVQQVANQIETTFNSNNEQNQQLQQPTEMYQPINIAATNTNVDPNNMPENGC